MSCNDASARAASSSSIFDMAKPTWMSTQSPGLSPSSSRSPMLMIRVTPETSTRARCSCTSLNALICPGIPRHMTASLLWLFCGEDLDPDVHLGLDLQQQDAGRIHAEFPDVEAGLPGQADRLFVHAADAHQVLVVARDATEFDVTADEVTLVLFGRGDLVQRSLDLR